MTSKPTARERFEEEKKKSVWFFEHGIKVGKPCECCSHSENSKAFLLSLVEAAVQLKAGDYNGACCDKGNIDAAWQEIDQRLSEAEGKGL